jgi:uncharacterized protein (DUF1499 family)
MVLNMDSLPHIHKSAPVAEQGAIADRTISGRGGALQPVFTASDRLAPCPGSPNCVSTLAKDELHAIAAIDYIGDAAAAKSRLLAVVNALPRTKVVADEGNYLRVEFRSRIFRFVDDVEFVLDDGKKHIHFRSASRLGYGDMGANRARMEQVRAAFLAADR